MELFRDFPSYLSLLSKKITEIDVQQLQAARELIVNCRETGGKIICAGNGGSASIASHTAVDLTKAAKVRAITFNEANLVTCFANDFGYENWLAKALESYADKGDCAILISSSGKSKNILNAAKYAKENGLSVITLSGFAANNPLRSAGDINLWVDSQGYNIIEMAHHVWLSAVIDAIVGRVEYPA